jgi:short-subunit dehydrogenase
MSRSVVITGATSGIGRALAAEYAAAGVTLGLLGRDAPRLAAVEAECQGLGACVETAALDVRDTSRLVEWLRSFDERHAADLVIINAGVLTGVGAGGADEPLASALRAVDINLKGAIACADAFAERMRTRRSGHIAFVSSLAGLLPQPHLPAYSASKAGLVSYGVALGHRLRPSDVRVSVICPGYVDSPMTRRESGGKPFVWSAQKAARHIRRRLDRGRPMIAFPWPLVLGIRLLSLAPAPLHNWIVGRFATEVEPDAEGRRERGEDAA